MIYMTLDTPEKQYLIDRLYSRYEQMMYKIAFTILNNRLDAEDAVHNAFLKIIQSSGLSAIEGLDASAEKSYIAIAAKNAAIDCFNSRKKKSADNIELHFADKSVSPEEVVFTEMEVERVERAMLKLPSNDYKILYFSVVLGLENKEISARLNIKEGAVRQRIHRAKIKLKNILKKEEEFVHDK